MENVDGRSEGLILQTSKNIHRSINVDNFLLAKSSIGRINRTRGFVSGHYGHLIIEPFGAAKISLSEVWENVVLNVLAVQNDYDPVHFCAARPWATGGIRYVTSNRAHQSRNAWLKLPACQGASGIKTIGKLPIRGLRRRVWKFTGSCRGSRRCRFRKSLLQLPAQIRKIYRPVARFEALRIWIHAQRFRPGEFIELQNIKARDKIGMRRGLFPIVKSPRILVPDALRDRFRVNSHLDPDFSNITQEIESP